MTPASLSPVVSAWQASPLTRRLPIIPLFMLLTVSGLAMRLVISWYAIGSNDAFSWSVFAESVSKSGLFHSYQAISVLNHPPFAPEWAALALSMSQKTGISFHFIFRLLPILADTATCMLLHVIFTRRHGPVAGWAAAAGYSCCLLPFLVSGYHCNTDNVMMFFCLLAVYYLEDRKQYFYAGLALAAAINVKIVPIMLLMPLYTLCRSRRQAVEFTGGLAVGVLPFIPPLVSVPKAFFSNVFQYNSYLENWGVNFFMGQLSFAGYDVSLYSNYYVPYGRYLIFLLIAVMSVVALRHRAWDGYRLAAMTMALFLILTPGFGVQYTLYAAPLLFAVNLRLGLLYGMIAGLYLLTIYWHYWTGKIPAYSGFYCCFPMHSALIGAGAYLLLAVFLGMTLARGLRQRQA